MRKITAVVMFVFITAGTGAFGETARDIIGKADAVFKENNVYSTSVLTIFRGGKAQPPQEIKNFTMQRKGKSYSLTIYLAPKRMKGTAMLMVDNDLWVRFASTGRVRKMSSSAKKNSAGGSDFSYADMGDSGKGVADMYDSSLSGEKKIDGISCYEIILTPKSGEDPPYEKMIVYVSKDNFLYIKIDYYENGANIKTMKLTDYRDVGGGLKYPYKVVMKSHVKDSKTEIITEEFEVDSSQVKEKYFSASYLNTLR